METIKGFKKKTAGGYWNPELCVGRWDVVWGVLSLSPVAVVMKQGKSLHPGQKGQLKEKCFLSKFIKNNPDPAAVILPL